MNKLLKHIQINNITELNELINIGAKLVSDKIGYNQSNQNRNAKNEDWRTNKETTKTSEYSTNKLKLSVNQQADAKVTK